MTDNDIQYKAFLAVWKVLGQTRPGITYEERFITALLATSNDKLERAKRINSANFRELIQKSEKLKENY